MLRRAGTCVMKAKSPGAKGSLPQPARARRMSFSDFDTYEQVPARLRTAASSAHSRLGVVGSAPSDQCYALGGTSVVVGSSLHRWAPLNPHRPISVLQSALRRPIFVDPCSHSS
eukprot:1175983-Prorocentrum_minimum.AAC.1